GRHAQIVVGEVRIVNSRHEGALHMFETLHRMEGGVRLSRNRADAGIELLQPTTDAGKGASRSKGRDKMRNSATGLIQNFKAGALEVRTPVRIVVVLIRVVIAIRVAPHEIAHVLLSAVRALHRVGQYELGTQSL